MNQHGEESVEDLQRKSEELQAHLAHVQQRLEAKKFDASPSLSHPSSQQHAPPVNFQLHAQHGLSQPKRAAIPRSKSNMGCSTVMSAAMMTTQDVSEHQAYKRQRRAFSQHSHPTQPMSRSVSNRSDSGMPFGQTGRPIAPLSVPSSSRLYHRDDMASHLPSVQENRVPPVPDLGMNPGEYLMANPYPSYLDTTRPNLSPDDAYANIGPSACPSMFSGTSAAEGPSPLSREGSSYDVFSNDIMMRHASSQSQTIGSYAGQDVIAPAMSHPSYSAQSFTHAEKFPEPEQALLGLSTDFSSFHSQYGAADMLNVSLSPESAIMERTESNSSVDSIKSNASSKSEQRFKEASERVRQASRAIIAPKPQEASADTSSKATSASQDGKVALPNRGSYQRPRHPKVQCEQCNEHPEGFRGDHELRRHINAKHHGGVVKKFVCRDPASVGLQSHVQVQHPLSKCKACIGGKEYGAYYNAAAHLRRTHFKPKTTRAKRGADDEKRGGMGGGDWPPMADLKLWFEEKIVQVDSSASAIDDADENTQETMLGSPIDGLVDTANSMSPFEANANFRMAFNGAVDSSSFDSVDEPLALQDSFGYPSFDSSQMSGTLAEYGFATPGGLSTEQSSTPATFRDMSSLTVDKNLWGEIQPL